MPLLGSVLTSLLLAVTLVLAAAVAGIMAYHYAVARVRERRGYTYDPEADATVPEAGAEQRARSAEEIAQIRSRIEALMEQQQIRSETQSQHLAQKLDEIRTHMGNQDRKMDGLKNELRHEIRRRDGELDELRDQLASALDAFWKSMPALPEGGDARALPPASSEPAPVADAGEELEEPEAERVVAPVPPASVAAEPPAAGWQVTTVEVPEPPTPVAFGDTAPHRTVEASPAPAASPAGDGSAPPSWEAPVWQAPAAPAPPAAPPETPLASWASPFEEIPLSPPSDTPPAPAPATPEPAAPAAAEAPRPAAPATPPAAPPTAPPPAARGDDLTVISGVTEEVQLRLYAVGVTTLDEMARWSRADARRISGLLGVPEEVIMHQWIFEAQSALFEHYQQMTHQA